MSTKSKYVSVLLVFVCIGMLAPAGGGSGEQTGSISGTVYLPDFTGAENAWLTLDIGNGIIYSHTSEHGFLYFFGIPAGINYVMTAGSEGYTAVSYDNVNVYPAGNTTRSIMLLTGADCDGDGILDADDPDDDNDGVPDIEDGGPQCSICDPDTNWNGISDLEDGCPTLIEGTVYNERMIILADVEIEIDGQSTTSDENGQYSFIVDAGDYIINASSFGYNDYTSENLVIPPGQTIMHDIFMEPVVRGAYAGAYQWGDSGDCDGVVDQEDHDVMIDVLGGGAGDYSGCFPSNELIQDLDGDNIVSSGDLGILRIWLLDIFRDYDNGKPNQIDLVDPPATVSTLAWNPLTVRVIDNAHNSPRAGWGVVFKINNDQSTCSAATIYGRPYPTIFGTGRDFYSFGNAGFDYTGVDGQVSVDVMALGCQADDIIVVDVFIPSDDEAKIWGERFPKRLDANGSFLLTVEEGEIPPITCAMNRHDVSAKNAGAAIIIMTIPLLVGFIARKKALNN